MACLYYAEDDGAIAGAVKEYLEDEGIQTLLFPSVSSIRKAMESSRPDMVLTDWILPDGNGDELCSWIRSRWPKLPVILITVRGETEDIVKGFRRGADDYLTKPFALPVLHSRVLALLRRADGWQEREITCDFHALNTEKMTVTVRQEPVSLSRAEYEILKLLMMNKGRTITRELLLERIWDSSGSYVNDNTLTVAMKRLREKLGHPACLKTVRSFGYRMEDTL